MDVDEAFICFILLWNLNLSCLFNCI